MTELGALRHLAAELDTLASAGLLRTPVPMPAGGLVLCSNDYLGYGLSLGGRPTDLGGPAAPWGAGASRLVSGELPAHLEAERALAEWLGYEAALLFTSGYAANVGLLAALAGPGDLIVSDALNHASIIDGCRLSGARIAVVPHADADAVEATLARATDMGRRWVVTESYFSMDGDSPDLAALRAVCVRWDAALVVDEAHALGVFGPAGRGVSAERGVRPDVLVGTFGKAFGLQGAFVAGPAVLRSWLWNRARSFVFSTGMSPALAELVVERVSRIAADDAARTRLLLITERMRSGLASIVGEALLPSHGPILPMLVGEPEHAVRLSAALRDRGFVVQAIRPPTVPKGTSRLRITAHAGLMDAEVDAFLDAMRTVWVTLGQERAAT